MFLAHAGEETPTKNKQDDALMAEFMMTRHHVGKKEAKAKVYLFNKDIKTKQYKKKNIKVEHYDAY